MIAALTADIAQARAAAAAHAQRLRAADTAIRNAIADGALPVFGRRGKAATGTFSGLDHEAIPATFFLHQDRTLNLMWGWATLGDDAATDEWALWRTLEAPDWGDLRFPKSALLLRFPAKPAISHPEAATRERLDGEAVSEGAEQAAPPPALTDLPAWWTLDQATVWIALRDTAAVRDAGPPRNGRDTRGVTAWHVTWAYRQVAGAELGPNPHAAGHQLAAAAGRGAIRSRGRPHTSPEPRLMDAADWALVTIADDPHGRGPKYLSADTEGGLHWRDVLVARDDVVREWQPFGEPPHEGEGAAPSSEVLTHSEILRTGAPGRPTSMHLIHGEHQRRIAIGEAHKGVGAEAEHLARWLRATHPHAPKVTPKTVKNQIAEAHRKYAATRPK